MCDPFKKKKKWVLEFVTVFSLRMSSVFSSFFFVLLALLEMRMRNHISRTNVNSHFSAASTTCGTHTCCRLRVASCVPEFFIRWHCVALIQFLCCSLCRDVRQFATSVEIFIYFPNSRNAYNFMSRSEQAMEAIHWTCRPD